MSTTQYPPMTRDRLSGIAHLGVTILGTSNRNNPLKYSVMRSDGTLEKVDRSDEVVWSFRLHHIDVLITVGGWFPYAKTKPTAQRHTSSPTNQYSGAPADQYTCASTYFHTVIIKVSPTIDV